MWLRLRFAFSDLDRRAALLREQTYSRQQRREGMAREQSNCYPGLDERAIGGNKVSFHIAIDEKKVFLRGQNYFSDFFEVVVWASFLEGGGYRTDSPDSQRVSRLVDRAHDDWKG